METNSSTKNCLSRSKKLPPPPLCLPATNTTTDEEKILNSNPQHERKKSINNCCLSSSSPSDDCSHESISYILPASQRSYILETLVNSSSSLLTQSSSETKHKKSSIGASANHINLLKQRQSSSNVMITDAEWIEFMRLILHKPLEDELKLLLDKYKMTYFDRINAPNTSDDTVRSSLCSMVAEALTTYSSNSISPPSTIDDLTTNISSPISSITTNNNNGSSKRKRKSNSTSLSISAPLTINNQTQFVISYIIPGKSDTINNGNKTTNQQQQKQFQKKYSHLFHFVPDKDIQEYLIREDHIKSLSTSSRLSNNNNICLMLYDEVIIHMDEYDLELSGILLDNSFTLPESIITQINSLIQ